MELDDNQAPICLDPLAPGPLGPWTPGPLDPWAPGPLDPWAAVSPYFPDVYMVKPSEMMIFVLATTYLLYVEEEVTHFI